MVVEGTQEYWKTFHQQTWKHYRLVYTLVQSYMEYPCMQLSWLRVDWVSFLGNPRAYVAQTE